MQSNLTRWRRTRSRRNVLSTLICLLFSFVTIYNGLPVLAKFFLELVSTIQNASHSHPQQLKILLWFVLVLLALVVARKAFRKQLIAPPGTILGDWITMRWYDAMMHYSSRARVVAKKRIFRITRIHLSLIGCDEWWARFDALDRSDQSLVERRANEVLSELKCDYNYEGLTRFDPIAARAVAGILGEDSGSLETGGSLQGEYEEREMGVIQAHTREVGDFAFSDSKPSSPALSPYGNGPRGYSLRRELRTIVVTGLLGYHSTRRDMKEWYEQEWQHVEGCGKDGSHSPSSSHATIGSSSASPPPPRIYGNFQSHAKGPHSASLYRESGHEGRAPKGGKYRLSQLVILQDFFRSERGRQGYGAGRNGEEYDLWLAQLTQQKTRRVRLGLGRRRSSSNMSATLVELARMESDRETVTDESGSSTSSGSGAGTGAGTGAGGGGGGTVRSWGAWVRLMDDVRVECEREQRRARRYRYFRV